MNRLILASGSAIRARLLQAAGVSLDRCPANVDEEQIKTDLLAEGRDGGAIAAILAEQKALAVSVRFPRAFVVGCDQILAFEGRLIAKSQDLAAAQMLLKELRGNTHQLLTACALVQGGTVVWRDLAICTMHMRLFSDVFLEDYLAAEGDEILASVGCYHYEGRGAQLFESVEGDYFSILGLPLLSLLGALRRHGLVEQ